MEKSGKPILRTGARHGDNLWVTGRPGSSAAGLAALRKWGGKIRGASRYKQLVQAHIQPVPRIEIGMALACCRQVHAMIDVSDGIAKECRTLAHENGLGVILNRQSLGFSVGMLALAGS